MEGTGDNTPRLQSELVRAVEEVRRTLGALAERERLPWPLMRLISIIDHTSIGLELGEGKASFIYDPEVGTLRFRSSGLAMVLLDSVPLSHEITSLDQDEAARVPQIALNLFVVHELIHVAQEFPHHDSVAVIKDGLPKIGLPILDVAADIAAAWVCANVEACKSGDVSDESVLRAFANILVIAYAVGAFVFNIRERAPKVQRALGLILAAALVQADLQGLLIRERINASWKPMTPLLVLDAEASRSFNALVLGELSGMLINNYTRVENGDVQALWDAAGKPPVELALERMFAVLIARGVIKVT